MSYVSRLRPWYAAALLLACSSSATAPPGGPVDLGMVLPHDGGASDASAAVDAGAGNDGGDPDGGGGVVGPPALLLASTFLGGLLALTVDPVSGALAPVTGSPYAKGAHFYGVALDPSGRRVYAVDLDADAIFGFAIGAGGALTPLDGSPYPNAGHPITIAFDPKGRFAYVGNSTGQSLSVLRVAADSGKLTPVEHSPFDLGGAPAFVAAEPSGRFVYLTQSTAGGIRAFTIADDSGAPTEVAKSPFATDVFGGGLVAHPNGRFLFGGAVSAFAIADSGALDKVDGSPFVTLHRPDAQAIDLALDAGGRFLYAIDSLEGKLAKLAVDADHGTLAPVAGSPIDAGTFPYSVAVDPQARFVYVGNDDVDQMSGFAVGGAGLEPLALSPFMQGGLQPQLLITALPDR